MKSLLFGRRLSAQIVGLAVAAAAAAALAPRPAFAQTWPDKPVTVIVPFGAGGGVDAAARIVLPRLGERLGQQLVIENVPGASGTIGTQRVVRARPDGHTLLFAVASPINVAPLVAPASVRYDALKELLPVAPVAVSPFVLVGRKELKAEGTAELLALARAQPGKVSYGTDGMGTSLHLTAATIAQQAGLKMMHVPYKSGPQALTDVAGGTVDLAVLPVALVQGMVREGKVRAYGVTSKQRSDALPGVPSLAETPALAKLDVESWMGLLAPAGTDAAIVSRLSREVAAVLAEPEVVKQLAAGGMKPMRMSPPDFAAYLARERQAMAEVVNAAGIKIE
ncbi:MAG: tripartite tricarboxylate transporter substrate binding protein [Rubrivivax sp.]|nr:tripartite tricarboxylate transporter substrate binding protein [Rubrivivax sp.]MCL4697082.1 tripartite tricarboxylate transporter substrate binding protein [Burkholderiaceae bacterium]